MKYPMVMPCPEWAEKLATTHPDDLSPSEREELESHMASCPACTNVHAQYQVLENLIRDLPADEPPPGIAPRLLQLREETVVSRPSLVPLVRPPVRREQLTTGTRKGKPTRVPQFMGTMAAVLVVGILLGAFVWTLHAHNLVSGPQARVTPQPTDSTGPSSGGLAIAIAPFPVLYQSVIYLSAGTGKLQAYRSDNGSLIRSYELGNGVVYASVPGPTIVDGVAYMDVKVSPGPGSEDFGAIYALRLSDGAVLWHHRAMGYTLFTSPVVADGVVYAASYGASIVETLYALRASDGVPLWHYQAHDSNESLRTPTVTVADGVAYVASLDQPGDSSNAYITALDANRGSLLWRHRVGTRSISGLTIANGVIYVAVDGFVSALRTSDASPLWRSRISLSTLIPIGTPTVTDGVVYASTSNGNIYALQASDGTTLWSYNPEHGGLSELSSPIVVDGVVYVGFLSSSNLPSGRHSYVYALRSSDGHLLWQYKLTCGGGVPALTVGNRVVYVMSAFGILYALQADDGAVLWHKNIGPYTVC